MNYLKELDKSFDVKDSNQVDDPMNENMDVVLTENILKNKDNLISISETATTFSAWEKTPTGTKIRKRLFELFSIISIF